VETNPPQRGTGVHYREETERLDFSTMTLPVRAAGLVLAMAADTVFADPRRGHPVAAFGRLAGALERYLYRDRRGSGVAFTAVCVGVPVIGAAVVERGLRDRPILGTLTFAALTWATLGGTSLRREGQVMRDRLDRGDLPGARDRLSYLCARDATTLGADELTRATVESLAENSSDAVVAPLFWALVGGLPGVIAYRAVNTLDAMVGYRSARYLRFGWASARLDDLANLGPARVTATLVTVLAPAVGGRPAAVRAIVRRDGTHHPSPNAGRVEAAFAGALGVALGGVNTYGDQVEDRGRLGGGPAPQPADIERCRRLVGLVGWSAAGLAATLAAIASGGR
jgi:adenosylcobinamide-phosphate synthase